MQIHCLGTTGYHPSPTRHTACYFIPEINLLLDAGTGLFRLIPLLQSSNAQELNIVLSHAHLDHVVGLTFLLDVMAVTPLRKVCLLGQTAKLDAIQQHLYSPLLFPVEASFDVQALSDSSHRLAIGECDIEYYPLDHPGGSLGFIVQAHGKRIAYLTDTTPRIHHEWISRLTGIDLLMHESYFDDAQVELALRSGHSWLSAVTELVERIRPKQTLLIHVNPLAEMLGYSFQLEPKQRQLNMFWAYDEMVIDV
jgi:ribonuclease BN (tRNA processing enzyme)